MKGLGEADVILDVKIRKTENNFSLCQSHYIEKLLKSFDYFDDTFIRTSQDASITLKKNKENSVPQFEYAKIIGSVVFLLNYIRLNIIYVMSRLSRYTHNYDKEHWGTHPHLLIYLKNTTQYCFHFNMFPIVSNGYHGAN